tara:strand:+ start:626 stop:1051 length:426 start_codon:yes stop_codon:yes gene_type:complete
MVTLAPDDMQILRSLSGYDLTLEIANMSTKYGIAKNEILAMLTEIHNPGYNSSGEYDPSPQSVQNAPSGNSDYKNYNSAARVIDKSSFHFEYDPTPGVDQKRQKVDQAILCPSCGVALGIPSIRPIKVTCPQCLQETTFTS